MKRQATKKEKYMREVEVEQLLLKGFREPDLLEILPVKWGVTDHMVKKYIEAVLNRWRATKLEEAPALRAKYLARLEFLLKEAVEAKHIKIALEVQKEINKISGLYDDAEDKSRPIEVITISTRDQSTKALPPSSSDDSNEKGD